MFLYNLFVYRLLGSFSLCLQQVIQDGALKVSEPLIDHNNRVTAVSYKLTVYSVLHLLTVTPVLRHT